MSFSNKTKMEIISNYTSKVACSSIEVACIVKNFGILRCMYNTYVLYVFSENEFIIKQLFKTLKNKFKINTEISVRVNKNFKKINYLLEIRQKSDIQYVLQLLKNYDITNCYKNYFALNFIINGNITDPNKDYHLEFVFSDSTNANDFMLNLKKANFNAKSTIRKKNYIVYIKGSEYIGDFLTITSAHNALMDFHNIRILKDISGNINRKVNLETANLNKTINAALQQEEDIKYLLNSNQNILTKELRNLATMRLENMDATLKELGEKFDPPLSKSCINHRLRKIRKIAKTLKDT